MVSGLCLSTHSWFSSSAVCAANRRRVSAESADGDAARHVSTPGCLPGTAEARDDGPASERCTRSAACVVGAAAGAACAPASAARGAAAAEALAVMSANRPSSSMRGVLSSLALLYLLDPDSAPTCGEKGVNTDG
jgi:hypothetical protein